MFASANLAFGIYPGLSHGAYHALSCHGPRSSSEIFLPKLADGTWSGTMCLTEPQCGTDLGLIRTKAVPAGATGATGSAAPRSSSAPASTT